MKKISQSKPQKTIQQIKEHIRSGDQKLIAEILGCTDDYVGMVLREDRKSERVLKLADELIDNRDAFIAKHKPIK